MLQCNFKTTTFSMQPSAMTSLAAYHATNQYHYPFLFVLYPTLLSLSNATRTANIQTARGLDGASRTVEVFPGNKSHTIIFITCQPGRISASRSYRPRFAARICKGECFPSSRPSHSLSSGKPRTFR